MVGAEALDFIESNLGKPKKFPQEAFYYPSSPIVTDSERFASWKHPIDPYHDTFDAVGAIKNEIVVEGILNCDGKSEEVDLCRKQSHSQRFNGYSIGNSILQPVRDIRTNAKAIKRLL